MESSWRQEIKGRCRISQQTRRAAVRGSAVARVLTATRYVAAWRPPRREIWPAIPSCSFLLLLCLLQLITHSIRKSAVKVACNLLWQSYFHAATSILGHVQHSMKRTWADSHEYLTHDQVQTISAWRFKDTHGKMYTVCLQKQQEKGKELRSVLVAS
jgi:alpha-glucuronidase